MRLAVFLWLVVIARNDEITLTRAANAIPSFVFLFRYFVKSRAISLSLSFRLFEWFIKNAIAFLIKCIENPITDRLLDTFFNSKAITLLLKTTRSDGERLNQTVVNF